MHPATRSHTGNALQNALSIFRQSMLVAVGTMSLTGIANADTSTDETQLADLSLEELTNIKVSSVNKKTQRAAEAAAAVFVITQDDIRRSGATSIPQALRLVPGLQVAQIDGNKWAISARGFNSRFANRVLVLMDGRTLYTLTFGGVFWDAQDTMIEDIERIEVIRGPGGAVWGANAFNGVINIITKSALQTDGGLVAVDAGTNRPIGVSARIADNESSTKWRAFAKGFDQNANRDWQEQTGNDTWRQVRVGGRVDIDLNNNDALQISAEAYQGKSGSEIWNYSSITPATIATDDNYDGAFATAEWTTNSDSIGRFTVHAVADHSNRDSIVFNERRNTFDLDAQHSLPTIGRHELMWGLGLRRTSDSTRQTTISVVPADDALTISNAFLQDDIALFNDSLHVTAGGKVEHSKYIGTQFMPNLRLRFSTDERTVVWTALSRGVRSGSRLERNVRVTDAIPSLPPFSPGNPGPAPLGVEIWGDDNFAPEKLNAYELGLRHRVNDVLSLDLATYYNDYADMRGVRLLPPVCAPSLTPVANNPLCVLTATKVIVPMQYTNLLNGNTWGAELSVTWNPLRDWRLIASYSYLNETLDNNNIDFGIFQIDFAKFGAGLDAKNQWTLRSSLSLGARWDWDVFLRHVDALPAGEVASYTDINTRIAWRPHIAFELALVGENLLHGDHTEFVSDFIDLAPVAIKRSVQLQARWSF